MSDGDAEMGGWKEELKLSSAMTIRQFSRK